jgi:hypothetical protein
MTQVDIINAARKLTADQFVGVEINKNNSYFLYAWPHVFKNYIDEKVYYHATRNDRK